MDAFVYDTVRTPRGAVRDKGALRDVRPIELLGALLRALVRRTGLDPAQVDDVILGCVTAVGEQGANLARVGLLYAGWPESVPGVTINRFCASGLDAVAMGASRLGPGSGLVVAGGVESMSRVPMLSDGGAWFNDPSVAEHTGFVPMSVAADLLATLEGIDREACDRYALRSQQRAAQAAREGRFARSLVPIEGPDGAPKLDRDECLREGLTAEKLARLPLLHAGLDDALRRRIQARNEGLALRPVHTVASSPSLADAASLVLLGPEDASARWGLTPRARLVAAATAAADPHVMLTGAVAAARRALDRAGLRASDLDLIEFNESFAATALHFQRSLCVDDERYNVNGGAIALGHPLGATGGILIATLLDELERRSLRRGLVAICAGAGLGTALIFERL